MSPPTRAQGRSASSFLRVVYEDRWRLRSYFLNHAVSRIPVIGLRMALMEALGVRFEDRREATVLLGTRIWFPENVTIGCDAVIGRECRLEAGGGIRIGRSANLSHGVRLQTGRHELDGPGFEPIYEPIEVHDRAWICEAAIVLGGVTVGEGGVVMAGAVVAKDVPPWTIVGGVPARPIRERPPVTYRQDWRPNFN